MLNTLHSVQQNAVGRSNHRSHKMVDNSIAVSVSSNDKQSMGSAVDRVTDEKQ